MELQGRSAVVTGGGNGIGRAIALALADEGVNVAVADLEADAAEGVAKEIEAKGVRSMAVVVDVCREADLIRLADEAWAAFGSVEMLFNNAGVMPDVGPIIGTGADDYRWVFDVNVGGVMNGIRVFAPRFVESGVPCRIVNTGSEHSFGVPHVFGGLYTATKHAVLGLSDVLRRELPPHVGVSVLCPGMVTSTLWKAAERRQDELGGAVRVPAERGAMMEEHGMPAEQVGRRVIEGLKEDAFFILTHAHAADIAKARYDEAAAAFTAQVPRYDGDDRYDVNKVMARIMGGGNA